MYYRSAFGGSLTVLLMFNGKNSIVESANTSEYANKLFDNTRVHTIDIQIEDWASFIENAERRVYFLLSRNRRRSFPPSWARAKGNNSLRLTKEYGLARYSLKLEFDQYLDGGNYYGLDKFSLDASFQDNSYLKTYMVYDMMSYMEVPASLCSYVWVTINGSEWGLFLAVEEPEEALHYGFR